MLHFRCISEECKQYVLLHGKSDTLEQLLESIKVFDSHLRLISYEKESGKHAKSFWTEDTLASFAKGKGKKGKDSKGKGKKGEKGKDGSGKGKKGKDGKGKGAESKGAGSKVKRFNCDEVGHFAS